MRMTYAECKADKLVSNLHHCIAWANKKAADAGQQVRIMSVRPGERPRLLLVVDPVPIPRKSVGGG